MNDLNVLSYSSSLPLQAPLKLAIIGSGISGLVSAYLLSRDHDITVFEANDYIGGHTVTSEIEEGDGKLAVDAGFIVYNESNYPNFTRLLRRLGVESQPTSMSFSVRCDHSGLEYAGTNLNTFFAQRSNLLRPSQYGLLRDILRFNRAAREILGNGLRGTLRDFLRDHRLSDRLAEGYLIPMTAAIWSTHPEKVLETPARFVLEFLDNHRLLGTNGHRPWRVVRGGSARYVEKLVAAWRDRVRLRTPVHRLRRVAGGVEVATDSGTEVFDEVVVAVHSDQALRMLAEPSQAEREVLGAIRYQANPAVLHRDASVLPVQRRAWASWNYRIAQQRDRPVAVTYNMKELQNLPTDTAYCVSLNMEDEVARESILRRFDFEHPLFTEQAVAAQLRRAEISGVDRIHYCGAYWGHGFHEDGVVSALAVTRQFGLTL